MSKPPLQKALIPSILGSTHLPPTSVPSGASPASAEVSIARGFYSSASDAIQAASITAPTPPGTFARPGIWSNPCPSSPAGSNVSMGSTPVPEDTTTTTLSTPMAEDPPPPPEDDTSVEYLDGVGFKNYSNVVFKGSSDNADNDFRIADVTINWIANLLNWMASYSRSIPPSHTDPLCTSLFALITFQTSASSRTMQSEMSWVSAPLNWVLSCLT